MPTPQELETRFWDQLQSDMTMMLGLDGVEDGHARPMTANVIGPNKPIWFFTSSDNELVKKLGQHNRAIATYTSRDHKLFATIHGSLALETDRAMIDRLWNKYVEAWYEGGKNDPKLRLLRLDAERGEIWENASSLFAGIKLMLGMDPKEEYKGKVAKVSLR